MEVIEGYGEWYRGEIKKGFQWKKKLLTDVLSLEKGGREPFYSKQGGGPTSRVYV